MSNFEIGYCPMAEYTAFEEKRVMESDLAIEGLYTIMFALQGSMPGFEAAKYPTRVRDLIPNKAGFTVVAFTVLNDDLGPDHESKECFQNGYWVEKISKGLSAGKHLVETGYFKEYSAGDGGEQELQDWVKKHTAIEKPYTNTIALV